jgi:protein-L-isoaspartate(D-aspartate) O-methyltransferase
MRDVEAARQFYARLVAGKGGTADTRIVAALAEVPRERFVGPGPWLVWAGGGYVETPDADPIYLYQDVLIALAAGRGINNGEPSLHARCLAALDVQPGETVLHIGAGAGYYTALLSLLAGAEGAVIAYEIEADIAARAAENLIDRTNVELRQVSGTEGSLPLVDAIYVNAGATRPVGCWLDALRPGGRLLFPLTPDKGLGGMLLVTRPRKEAETRLAARFVCGAGFIPCLGARDPAEEQAVSQAFRRGGMWEVRSLHRGRAQSEGVWCAGQDWWLSTAAID